MVRGCKVLCSKIGGRTQNRRIKAEKIEMITRPNGGRRTFRRRKMFRLSSKTSHLKSPFLLQHEKLLKKATTKPKACHQHPKSIRLYGANRKRRTTNSEQ